MSNPNDACPVGSGAAPIRTVRFVVAHSLAVAFVVVCVVWRPGLTGSADALIYLRTGRFY